MGLRIFSDVLIRATQYNDKEEHEGDPSSGDSGDNDWAEHFARYISRQVWGVVREATTHLV